MSRKIERMDGCYDSYQEQPAAVDVCLHEWLIWPETDGFEQRCSRCGSHRPTPKVDRDAALAQQPTACQCIDCHGDKPSHDSHCQWMRQLHGELLPLPEEEWNVRYGYYADTVREYARANVAHYREMLRQSQDDVMKLQEEVEVLELTLALLGETAADRPACGAGQSRRVYWINT